MRRVEVWVAPLLLDPPDLAALVATLTPAEVARVGRYRFADDARRFAAARGWLRHVLGARLGVDPADVAFVAGPGKPGLARGADLHFNLSRTADLAVVAVSDGEVGVDVEHVGGGRGALDAVRLACTPVEAEALDRFPPDARAQAFLSIWTAKEAYLKARGMGLTVPPDRVEIGAVAMGDAAPVTLFGDTGPPRWWVRRLPLGPDYVGAVVTDGPADLIGPRVLSGAVPAAGAGR